MATPHLYHGLIGLRAMFEASLDDLAELKWLAGALEDRKTPAARALAQEVSSRISELEDRQRKNYSQRATNRDETSDEIDHLKDRIKTLEAALESARCRETQLQRELATARAETNRILTDFGRVHLADTAPPWLISAARTAFRKQYHPDRYRDATTRRKAHEVFVAAEAIFEKIENP